MQAAVTSHLRATTGQRLVDVASADRPTVGSWLSTRLAFSAPVLEPDAIDATLVGRSVAALMYRLHDHIVDVFVLPMTDDDAAITTAPLRGFNVSHWSRGGLRYCVVSDLLEGNSWPLRRHLKTSMTRTDGKAWLGVRRHSRIERGFDAIQ